MPDFDAGFVALGVVGGAMPDVLRFVKQRHEGFPQWFSKAGFWVGFLLLLVLGGLAAWLGGADDWQAALALGYAAPEFISRVLAGDPVTIMGTDDEGFPIRKWWSK